ncbi:MAG: DUF4136 domain-containing protein [Ramlibacter sp.]
MKNAWWGRLVLALAALVLSGCAGGYLLESNVQAYTSLPAVPANPNYRFERLPSQQNLPAQTQLEQLADPALYRAGLKRDDAAPRFSVLVSARVQRTLSPWADPWEWGGGWGGGFGGPFPRMEQPWFQREVAVIVRELGSGKVVFESRAASDGPWLDNPTVLAAMFDAALQGFPNPPAGVRRVNIQVGVR